MDPDECLKRLKAALEVGDWDIVAQSFSDLDEWLTKGGFLPKDWAKARGAHYLTSMWVSHGIYHWGCFCSASGSGDTQDKAAKSYLTHLPSAPVRPHYQTTLRTLPSGRWIWACICLMAGDAGTQEEAARAYLAHLPSPSSTDSPDT